MSIFLTTSIVCIEEEKAEDMNILIVGGLLVIGVGALVALFFVVRSGRTARAKTLEAVPQTAREAPPTPVEPEPEPQTEQFDVIPHTPEVTHVSETRTVPVAETAEQDGVAHTQPVYEKEAPLRVHLNGQFHDLTQGLRSLQQQATEMEQRLSSLNQMLENIERNQPEEL